MSVDAINDARSRMSTTVDKTKMYVDMSQSQSYHDYRPRYCDEMFQAIVNYCKETNPTLNLAVDVGCGPGMSTIGFAKYFKKVVGVDVSETQVACAPKNIPNMEFKVGYSHQLPFIKSGSVDLFCTGESFNLMPHKETFAEADRVLRPGGTIAIFGYIMPRPTNPELNSLISEWYVKMLPYWPKESQQIFDKFVNVEFPYSDKTRRDDLKIAQQWTMENWRGMVNSSFPYVNYRKQFPNDPFLDDHDTRMDEAVQRICGNKTFEVVYDVFVLYK